VGDARPRAPTSPRAAAPRRREWSTMT
jgi:hypothetical protein